MLFIKEGDPGYSSKSVYVGPQLFCYVQRHQRREDEGHQHLGADKCYCRAARQEAIMITICTTEFRILASKKRGRHVADRPTGRIFGLVGR